MGNSRKKVLQVDLLRDQVYQLLLEDLKTGELQPGSRLVEGDLAKRYNVSRTPVREALFQLSREGFLGAAERGYLVAQDDHKSTVDRHEVRELIDPTLASHAAVDGTPAQRRALNRCHEKQVAAHEADDVEAFIRANVEFRRTLREMASNALLARCSQFLDDQAQPARRAIFNDARYREVEIGLDGEVVQAVVAGNSDVAKEAMLRYVDTVRNNLNDILDFSTESDK